jgi:DNA-binding transcriptional LysR family regulator
MAGNDFAGSSSSSNTSASKAAAEALGLHHQNLQLQLDRLETDIGAPLINRTTSRYQRITITTSGVSLLRQIEQPEVRRLLDQYAPAPPTATNRRSGNVAADAAVVGGRTAKRRKGVGR